MSLLYRVDCDDFTLFDPMTPGYDAATAELEGEIADGMFNGTLHLTLPCTNPNASKVRMLASTIIVTEIADGEEKVRFRGRPISIETTFDLETSITCENDLKFLADIPDIFSQVTKNKTDYKIGTESALEPIHLRLIPEGELLPRVDKQSRFSRFYENRTYQKDASSPVQTVYRSATEPGYFFDGDLYYHHRDDGTQFVNYRLNPSEVGKKFTVEFDDRRHFRAYELELKTGVYSVVMYGQKTRGTIYVKEGLNVLNNVVAPNAGAYVREREEKTAVCRYLGNINLIAKNNDKFSGLEEFNPNEDVTVIGETEPVKLGDLDFCIVHYTLSPRWTWSNVGRGGGGLFWSVGGIQETIIYTTASDIHHGVSMRLSCGSRTTVRAMAHAILGRDSYGQYPYVKIDGKKYGASGGTVSFNGEQYPVVFETVSIGEDSYAVGNAFFAQDMTDPRLCYRYTGDDIQYVTDWVYIYEPGTGWVVGDGPYLSDSLIRVETPQAMTDRSKVYQYIGNGESYLKSRLYRYNGTLWEETSGAQFARHDNGAVVVRNDDTPDGEVYSVNSNSSGIDDAAAPQDMTNQRLRYNYTGPGVRYEPYMYYIYEPGIGWEKHASIPFGTDFLDVKIPQDMVDKSMAYHYMGDEEVYQNGGTYSFNGTRWVKESITYNNFVPPERQIYLGKAEADADVEYTSIDTCYSNLQKWVSETGAYAKTTERDGRFYLDLTRDSGVPSDDFYVRYGENIVDAKKIVACDNIVTGVYVKGVWKGSNDEGSKENPAYELTLQRLFGKEVRTSQQMTDITATYKYVGNGEEYVKDYYYQYDENAGVWVEYTPAQPGDSVDSKSVGRPQDMTNTNVIYQYTGDGETYAYGRLYRYEKNMNANVLESWKMDGEAIAPMMSYGFEADYETGVIWNTEARKEYGNIVFYLEVDVAGVSESRRTQYMADEAIKELRTKLVSFLSFDISRNF